MVKEIIEPKENLKIDWNEEYTNAVYNLLVYWLNDGKIDRSVFEKIAPKQNEIISKTKLHKLLQENLAPELYAEFEDKITEFQKLHTDEIEYQYLDLGCTNDTWYYGNKVKGKDAIITSNPKKIWINYLVKLKNGETFGENEIKEIISYKGHIGEIAPLWKHKNIKKYLLSDKQINPQKLYNSLKEKILYYMDFGEESSIADVQACWIIGTYCYPLFYWFPHILFNAPRESGKSKNAFILIQLSFRGYDLGASAGVLPAQIYRVIEGNRGTMLIDEYERSNNDIQTLVNQLLNASCSKDAYVTRNEPTKSGGWQPTKFPIFCPKIVCNITGINATSLSRFIPFHLFRTISNKGKQKPYREADKKSFEPLRSDAHILIMQNWKKIKEIYDTLELDLINRDEDNWLPICAIAKFIGDDAYENVLKYIETYREIKLGGDDRIGGFFYTLYENVTDLPTEYTSKDIMVWFPDDDFTGKWITNRLRQYKLKRGARKAKGQAYWICKSDIKKIIDAYYPEQTTLTTLTTQNTLTSLTTQQKDAVSEVSVVSAQDCEVGNYTEKLIEGLDPAADFEVKDIEELIGKDGVEYCKSSGLLYEVRPGVLKVLK